MYTHLAILDFEANCLRDRVINPQEIVEVPVVVYDLQKRQIDETKTFHYYCKPMIPITDFCTELTGITQETVDNGLPFKKVINKLTQWVWENGWITQDGKYTVLFVTHGDWDLQTALPKQCRYSGIKVPGYLREWCNLKLIYQKVYHRKGKGMARMLDELNMPLIGKHHSGIDDTRNIARMVQRIHSDGGRFKVTGRLPSWT